MTETPAQLYSRLRIETAALLGFDLSALTASQGARLDRATMLRWELDRIAGSQVRGDAIDVSRAVTASEALERLLSPAASLEIEAHESHSARNRLAQLINSISEILSEDRRDEVGELQAVIARLQATIAEKDSALRAVLGGIPAAAPKQTPPAASGPQQVSNPLPPPSSKPPAHYLRPTDTVDMTIPASHRTRWK
jgi:hypothetical protein